jgi:cysteine desulfurase family protein (TIGR01976 family)
MSESLAAEPPAKHAASQASQAMIDEIRRQFPALSRRHEGHPVAYFDGPGGTQVARPVVEAMADYLYHHNANEGWTYPSSRETDAIVAAAREAVADLMNGRPEEIVFGQNMTSLTFHVSRALGRQFALGAEIVVTELDHHGNVDPWRHMARDRGLTVRVARMIPGTGRLDWDHLESLLKPGVKLLAIGAASNALGTMNDIRRAANWAHAAGALVYVDAVHYAPHHLIDVQAWDCDFAACSAYKFYGPHTGIVWGRSALLQSLDVPKLEPASNTAPDRIETGTQSFESIHGTAAAVDFLAGLGTSRADTGGKGSTRRERLAAAYDSLHGASSRLFQQLWEGLAANPRVTVYGPPPGGDRAPTVSLTVAGMDAKTVSEVLAGQGIFVSHGNFYALTIARRLGREHDGLVRVGLSCYHTGEEIDRLLRAIPS